MIRRLPVPKSHQKSLQSLRDLCQWWRKALSARITRMPQSTRALTSSSQSWRHHHPRKTFMLKLSKLLSPGRIQSNRQFGQRLKTITQVSLPVLTSSNKRIRPRKRTWRAKARLIAALQPTNQLPIQKLWKLRSRKPNLKVKKNFKWIYQSSPEKPLMFQISLQLARVRHQDRCKLTKTSLEIQLIWLLDRE